MSETITVSLEGAGHLGEGERRSFKAGEFNVLVCRVKGELFAVEDLCSHQKTPLCDGSLDGYFVVCAKHNARFDLRDGKHQGPPAFKGIPVFDITEDGSDATVTVPARKEPAFPGIGPAPFFRTQ